MNNSIHSLGKLLYLLINKYPTPGSLSYSWNFGVLGLIALVLQLITGIVLSMYYTPHTDYAFYSVEHITRDINIGYLLR